MPQVPREEAGSIVTVDPGGGPIAGFRRDSVDTVPS